jgi:hypothetical protein
VTITATSGERGTTTQPSSFSSLPLRPLIIINKQHFSSRPDGATAGDNSLNNITTSNSIFTNHTNLALHSNGNLLEKLQQLQLPVAAAPSSQWQLHFLNPTTINSSTP